jgi:hypothetical protein
MRSRHYRLRPTHSCSDADWDSYLDAKADHANPDDAWERKQKVCPWCGDAPKAWDEDRCTACLELQAEKEAETMSNAQVHPIFRGILATMSGGGIGPTPPLASGGEPPEARVPDSRTISQVCEDILTIATRIRGNK